MMKVLYEEKGSSFSINILKTDEAQAFIDQHASILDSTFSETKMSGLMRERLQESDYVFSGMKTFHELHEAFPSLLDEKGNRKPFETFLKDVQTVNETYNKNYLRAEYNFVQASSEMAGRWEEFDEDPEGRYMLQYRTAGDAQVRPEHAALEGVTLPKTDNFWDAYYPPNGWNCRCTAIQVRKDKYPTTSHDDAMKRGVKATADDKKNMFNFNAGKQKKTVPDYNPYTTKDCRTCNKSTQTKLAAFIPSNELCAACKIVKECYADKKKSEKAIERKHYMREMEPLLKKNIEMKTEGGKTFNIGFTKAGNKHLYSDTISRSRVLQKEDLAALDKTLRNSTYIGTAELTHNRTDGISTFYYYKGEIRGEKIRLNVAKQIYTGKDGRVDVKHFLYSINDIK